MQDNELLKYSLGPCSCCYSCRAVYNTKAEDLLAVIGPEVGFPFDLIWSWDGSPVKGTMQGDMDGNAGYVKEEYVFWDAIDTN